MIEKLEEYGRFLFGWAFRAMQSEMTMQESLNAKSERSYLTGTEIALLEDSSLFIIGIGILVLIEAFFLVAVISLLLHSVMKLIGLCLVKGYSCLTREKRYRKRAVARRIQSLIIIHLRSYFCYFLINAECSTLSLSFFIDRHDL